MDRLFDTPNFIQDITQNGHNSATSFNESSFAVNNHEQIDSNNNHEQSSSSSSSPGSPKKADRLPLNSPAISYAQASGIAHQEPKATLDYLNQLFEDKKKLQLFGKVSFFHLDRLVDIEIQRVRASLIHIDGSAEDRKPLELPEPEGDVVQRSIKIFLPVDKYPDFNFAGRLIGPRGLTIRELESVCQCKFYIRGKGSMRNKSREEQLREQPSYEHLYEEQHVKAIAEDTENRAEIKLERARQEIEKIIDSVINNKDDFKKRQLAELAILNDKYKIKDSSAPILPIVSPSTAAMGLPLLDPSAVHLLPSPASVTGVPITPFDSLFASQVPLPVPPPPQSAPPGGSMSAYHGLDTNQFLQFSSALLPVMHDPKILNAMAAAQVSQASHAAAVASGQFNPSLAGVFAQQIKTNQTQRFHPYRKQ